MSWLVEQDQLEPAIHLSWATWRFWWLRGHAEELASYVDILPKSEHLPPRQRALALSGTGFGLFASGDPATAQPLLEQSLPLYRQAGDMLGAATTAAMLGHLLALQHQDARASELLEQTLAPLQEAGNDRLAAPERAQHLLDVALVCNFLGQIRLSQADHDRAAQLFTEALNAARSAQDRFTILVSLYDLALSSQAQGDLAGAAEHLQEGVSQSAEARDEPSVAYYLEALAAVAIRQDNPERVAMLMQHGAKIDVVSADGLTPLAIACLRPSPVLAIINSRSKPGTVPCVFQDRCLKAKWSGHWECEIGHHVVELLADHDGLSRRAVARRQHWPTNRDAPIAGRKHHCPPRLRILAASPRARSQCQLEPARIDWRCARRRPNV